MNDSPKDLGIRDGLLISVREGVDGLGIRDGGCCRWGVLRPSSAFDTAFNEDTFGMPVFAAEVLAATVAARPRVLACTLLNACACP